MIGAKFNVVMRVLLLTGTIYAGDLPGECKNVPAKGMAAPSDKEFGGFAEAQFLYGVYCKEKLKDDKTAYKYLELAAKQYHRYAWLYLGKCYFDRKDEHYSYLLWSKLCYMAAERIVPDAETEFRIGLLEGFTGNLEEYKKWMKLSADKGFSKAAEMLANKDFHSEIISIRKQRNQQKNPDALKQAINSHHEKIRQITGTTGPEVLDQLAGRPVFSNISKMIRLSQPSGIKLPNWNYNAQATEALISENLMADREGDMRWITDEFKEQPIWENLAYPNPTIRAINATREDALTKSLDNSFKRCAKDETKRLIKPFMDSDMPEDFYDGNVVWNLGNDLYFRIHTDTSGRWMLRDYQFFLLKNDKTISVVTFPNPPDTADADLIAGIIQNNADCWNNLAVKYADGEMDQVFRCDDEAEEILKMLVKRRHVVGTYNLAVFYQNRGKTAEAKKYFALAEEFAGSSVIHPQVNLPEIFDRNGVLLVKNNLFRTQKENLRIYANGGRFAASWIGHIQHFGERTGRDSAGGRTGIEEIVFRKNITHPVYLTLDTSLQTQLEKLIFDIASKSDPRYAYGIIVSSKGELIAASQSSIFDLLKRNRVKQNPCEDWNGEVFMPVAYMFPVPDQWMKLLGSSSYADPLSKEKFQLHTKPGIFSYEQPGIVLGLNQMKGIRDPKQVSAQTAILLKYVLAYIGVAEKKDIPVPVVYTDKVNTTVKTVGNIEWISFYRPPDGIVVNALGVIKTDNPEENLYICIRAVHEERNFVTPHSVEVRQVAAAKADKAEKLIRDFKLSTDSQRVAWQRNISDAMKQIVKKTQPVATQILLYDIQKGKIAVSEQQGREMPYFPPMSFLKPFVITAALEAGTVKMDDVIDCSDGRIQLEDRWLRDVRPLGKITVAEILKNSSNIGTWLIAQKLGFTPLENFLKQAGFKKSLDMKKGELEFSRYAIGAKHLVAPEDVIAAWAYLLKYPETAKAIKNPLGTTALHLKENQHKYTYAVVGYLPADKPRYILLLTAHDFSKTNNSIQGIRFLCQQWKDLSAKFNREVK